eukprot:3788930-Lingulodinium_polyedra.AAC.1
MAVGLHVCIIGLRSAYPHVARPQTSAASPYQSFGRDALPNTHASGPGVALTAAPSITHNIRNHPLELYKLPAQRVAKRLR